MPRSLRRRVTTLWRYRFDALQTFGSAYQKKATKSAVAFLQNLHLSRSKVRSIFIYIGAQEGTRTPTKLLAST